MRKLVGSAVALVLVATMVAACGGYTEEEAQERCAQEKTALEGGGCFTDATTTSCVDAHVECGDEAQSNGACPLVYSCAAD